jgi:ABC-type branched-subunit amino acid transport system substrate-binding protein
LIENESVFAVVSGLTAGADEKIATLSQDSEVPFIGPSTLLPQTSFPLNRYVFYLLPGLEEQAGALLNFAVKKIDRQNHRIAIVSPNADLNRRISVSIENRSKKLGLTTISGKYYPRNQFNAAEEVAVLKKQGVENVFFLGSDADLKAFITEGEAAGWNPSIYALGALVGKDISAVVPVKMKDKIFLAFPTIPADLSQGGAAIYSALVEKNKLGRQHIAARLSALAAATILVEGLKLAGKDLSRERLVSSLEGLYEFNTGFMPQITFGPNRRIGALGAYVVTIDPEKKQFAASAQWVASE